MNWLSEDSTEQPLTWMMVSEIELLYAESIQFFAQTRIPESLLQLHKEQLLASASRSYYQVSCGMYGLENSDIFHDFIQENFMGSHFSRTKPPRARVTSSRARTQTQSGITARESCCKRNRIFCCRDEPIPHRDNSCAAGTCSCEANVLRERDCSYGTKEVDWHSCQQMAPGRCSFNRNLKIGHEIGTSLWSRRKRSRRHCSLGFDGPRLRNAFLMFGSSETRFQCCMSSKETLPCSTCAPFKDTQEENFIALELLGYVAIPYNWKEFIVHKGSSFDCTSILKSGLVAGGRTSKDGRQTVFFAQSDIWKWTRRNIDKRRLHETKNGTFLKQVETFSGRCLLGQFSPSTKTKDYNSDKHGRMPLLYTVLYHQRTRWFLEMENEFYLRDSRRLDLRQKLYSKVLCKRSSSKRSSSKTLLGVHQFAAGNSLRKFWWRKRWKNNSGKSTEESETSRSRKLLRSAVPNITHVEEKPEFQVDFRIEGIAHDVSLNDEERMGQIQEVVERLRTDSYTKSIREDPRKSEKTMIFSEESRRITHELGNLGLYELG